MIRDLATIGDSVLPTLRTLQEIETDPELQKQLGTVIRSSIMRRIWQSLRNGNPDEAEKQLRLIGSESEIQRSFAAFFSVQNRLDEVIPELKSEFARTKSGDVGRQLTYSLRAAGRLDESLSVSRLLNDRRLIDGLLFESGNWRELANRRAALPSHNVVVDSAYSRPLVEYNGFRAGCLRLSGNASDAARLLDDLSRAVRTGRTIAGYRTFAQDAARVLLINDRPQAAIELITDHAESMPHNANVAFDLLCSQDRYDDAFEFGEQFVEQKYRGYDRLESVTWLKLNALGERETALRFFSESFDAGNATKNMQQSIYAATGLMAIGAIDAGLDANLKLVDAAKIESRDRKEWDVLFARSLAPPDPAAADAKSTWISNGVNSPRAILLTLLLETFPDDAPKTLFARARFLLGLPTLRLDEIDAPSSATLMNLLDRLAVTARTYENYAIGKSMEGLAFVCFRAGEFERGRKFLREGISLGGQASQLPIADSYAEQKNWKAAFEEYRSIRSLAFADFATGWCQTQLGCSTNETSESKKRMLEGNKRMQLATLQFLDNTSSRRSGIALLVNERGWTLAESKLSELTRRTDEFGSIHLINAYGAHGNDANGEQQLQVALDSWERNHLSSLDLSTIIPNYTQLLSEPFTINRVRARLLFSQGRIEAAEDLLRVAHNALPGREDIVLEFVPLLRERGRHEFANILLGRVYEINHRVCQRFGNSLEHRLRLVRLSVEFDWRINDGLEHARAAMRLSPSNVDLIQMQTTLKNKLAASNPE